MSYLDLNETGEPGIPSSGKVHCYVDSADRYLKTKDSKGVIGAVGDHELSNWIRNSGFWFAQRQAPGSATTYSATAGRAISADGWGITNENASATYQRTDTAGTVETGLQGRFYGNFLKTTSTGKLVVTQVLEGHDTCALRGRTVRVQCWMKQLVASAPVVRLGLIQLNTSGTIDTMPATYISAFGANGTDPTLGTNLAYILPKAGPTPDNGTVSGNAVSCTLSASWQRFGGVFDVPVDCKNLVISLWGNAQFAATNGFALAQASLTDGYEIQNWCPLAYEQEFERCLRFYCKTFNVDQNPTTSVGAATGEHRFPSMVGASAAIGAAVTWEFPVPMRAAPGTLTLYNPSAANAQVRNITDGADCSASSIAANGEKRAFIATTSSAGTAAGEILGVHISADAEL